MSKTWAYFFLLLSAAITIGACYTLPKTFFDYDFEKFFKANDRSGFEGEAGENKVGIIAY